METGKLPMPRVDGKLLEAVAYLHEAGRIFDDWSDSVRRDQRPFWDFYSDSIIRVSTCISDMESEAAFLVGMKLPYDSAEER